MLKTGNIIKNIFILNTYSPHTQYNKAEIDNYWGDVNNIIRTIPNNQI